MKHESDVIIIFMVTAITTFLYGMCIGRSLEQTQAIQAGAALWANSSTGYPKFEYIKNK